MPQWSPEELVSSAVPSPAGTAPALAVRGLGIIDEFDVVQPPLGSRDPWYLEQNWKDPTSGFNTWQPFLWHSQGPMS